MVCKAQLKLFRAVALAGMIPEGTVAVALGKRLQAGTGFTMPDASIYDTQARTK